MNKKYLSELTHYDGDHLIRFNIVEIKTDKGEIVVAITNEGKITVTTFDLMSDKGRLFFEYGIMREEINVDDFTKIKENN